MGRRGSIATSRTALAQSGLEGAADMGYSGRR